MGRGKHCTSERRDLIQTLINSGKTYKEVQELIGCSAKLIRNATTYKRKDETRGRKKILALSLVKRVIRYSKCHPNAAATDIAREFNLSLVFIR